MPRLHSPWHPYAGRHVVRRDGRQHYYTIDDPYYAQRRPHGKVLYRHLEKSQQKRSITLFRSVRARVPIGQWKYRPGMKVGRGVPMTSAEIRNLTRGTGTGTFDDPKVLYNTEIEHVSRELIQQCEVIVKAEARRLGMTCVIIR